MILNMWMRQVETLRSQLHWDCPEWTQHLTWFKSLNQPRREIMCHNADLSFFFLWPLWSFVADQRFFNSWPANVYSDCKSIATFEIAPFRWLTLSYDDRSSVGSAFNAKFRFKPFDFGAPHFTVSLFKAYPQLTTPCSFLASSWPRSGGESVM